MLRTLLVAIVITAGPAAVLATSAGAEDRCEARDCPPAERLHDEPSTDAQPTGFHERT